MVKRSRLSRGNPSKKNNRLDKLRQTVVLELKEEPNSALKRYANVSDKELAGNPALALLRTEAREVLAERQKTLSGFQSGELTQEQKAKKDKPLIKKIIEGEQKVVGLIGKGFNEYMKIISGEKARELEETIATIGMKPEEKKKTIEKLRKQTQEEMDEDFYPGKMPEHAKESKDFVEHRKQLDKDIEPVHSQEPKGIAGRREEFESEDFSLGKVLPAEKKNGNGSPSKPVPKPPVTRETPQEVKGSSVTVNVNVGSQGQMPGGKKATVVSDLHDIPEFLQEEKMATRREMDRAHEGEGVQDIIAEGRADLEEEQRQLAKEKKEIFK